MPFIYISVIHDHKSFAKKTAFVTAYLVYLMVCQKSYQKNYIHTAMAAL